MKELKALSSRSYIGKCLDCLAVEPVEPLLIGYSYAFRPVFGQIVWSYHLIRNTTPPSLAASPRAVTFPY